MKILLIVAHFTRMFHVKESTNLLRSECHSLFHFGICSAGTM